MEKIRQEYNERYGKDDAAYGEKVAPFVKDILKYKKEGSVLDLGAGQGRNALYLAEQGFKVKAIDISDVGISTLKEKSAAAGLEMETEVGDISVIELGKFDVIISTYVLHHILGMPGQAFIEKIKAATNTEGLNVISAFTTEGDFQNNPDFQGFYLEPGELQKLYSDWEVLEYREVRKEMLYKNPDGTPTFNNTAIIIARKP